jgi:regulator of replication initiation timing
MSPKWHDVSEYVIIYFINYEDADKKSGRVSIEYRHYKKTGKISSYRNGSYVMDLTNENLAKAMNKSESEIQKILNPEYTVMIQGIQDGNSLREIRRYEDGTYKELYKNQLYTRTNEYAEAEIDRITKDQEDLIVMEDKINQFPLLESYLREIYIKIQQLRYEKSKLITRNDELSFEIQKLKGRGFWQRVRRTHEANLSDLMTQLKNIGETGNSHIPVNHL